VNRLSPDQGQLLVALARNAIARKLDQAAPALAQPDWLKQPGAVFVTLTQQGELRGCIGSLEASRSLLEDLLSNARAAAFNDPRFLPLSRAELAGTRIEVSLLSPPEPMSFTSEADALAQLQPNIDGVILEYGSRRATFLPQVWQQLPEPRQFINNLKRKAGLASSFWADDVRLSRYRVEKFQEEKHEHAEGSRDKPG
jgi:AmmeMemoRadiSam system protein A